MRRTCLALTFLAWGATALHGDRATPDRTKTQMALPLATAPTIDGVISTDEWTRAGGAAGDFWAVTVVTGADGLPVIRGGALGDAGTVPADASDLSYTVYAGMDANDLYLAVRVKDSLLSNDDAAEGSANGNTWMDDSVEVFIDGDNSNFPNRDTTGSNAEVVGSGGQFVITANNAYREAEAGNPGFGPGKAWEAVAIPLEDGTGYVAEFRISLKTIGSPKPGDLIGFTVGVNDDDDGGAGDRQVVWVGRPHTEVTYGNLLLGGRSYTAPKVGTAPAVDGLILPAEYAGAQRIVVRGPHAIYDIPSGDDTWPAGDCEYDAWIVHTADAVYVAMDVVDDLITTDSVPDPTTENGSTWEDDSVEIFFDADSSKDLGRGTQLFEGQYVMTAAGAWRTAEANNPVFGTDWTGMATRTFRGYQVEFQVKKSSLLNPADGASMGFQLAANDDDGAGRKAQPGWSGRAHSEFTYGTLTLGGPAVPPTEPPGRKSPDETKTQMALPLATAPTIDGVISTDEWTRAGGAAGDFWAVTVVTGADGLPVIRGGALGDAGTVPADASDLSYTVYAGMDANDLYLAVRVKDSLLSNDDAAEGSANGNTWMDDSVEVFIDGDNSNFPNRDTTGSNAEVVGSGGQFVITANNAYREAEAGNPGFGPGKAWEAVAIPLEDGTGYVAEFRISLKTIGSPKPGDLIGFTVGVNDDDDGGAGDRQVVWVGRPHTEVTYGNLLLGGRSYTAPKVGTAPAVDGLILPAEYAGAQRIVVRGPHAIYDIPSGDDTWPAGDCEYDAWIVHTADAVYVAMDVVDDLITTDSVPDPTTENGSTWEDDSVEIFFDADSSKDLGRGTQLFEGQYVMTAAGAWRTAEANNPVFGTDWTGMATRTFRGYQVEFQVKKSSLLNPADGASMGFQLAANDDDGAGRKAQPGWSGRAHSEFTYGTLTLGGSGGGGGSVSIKSIAVNGANLEITITTSNPSGTHLVQETGQLVPVQWSDQANATFTPGAGGTVVAKFPKPATAPKFYRVGLR